MKAFRALCIASLGVLMVATTCAQAQIVRRAGVGVGRVGSGLGYRPGIGIGRAGLGVRGWRGGLGYGYGRWGYRGLGYGGAALTGAALAATGLYNYSPTYFGGGASIPGGAGYTLVQFDGGHCEVWSNGIPSGGGWTPLAGGLPNWDAGEAAYHFARAQGVCH